jgi:hypothetical protein
MLLSSLTLPLSLSLSLFVVVLVAFFFIVVKVDLLFGWVLLVSFYRGVLSSWMVVMAGNSLGDQAAPSPELVPALSGPLVRRLRVLTLLGWIGVSVGMRGPCYVMVRSPSPSSPHPLVRSTYLAGERRTPPGLPGRTRARTAGGRGSAAARMAAGCRTRCPAWVRRPRA